MAARVSLTAQIPFELIRDEKLNCTAKLLYLVMTAISEGRKFEISLVDLGRTTGILPNNLPRLLEELEEAGWLQIKRGGPGQKSAYTLMGDR